MLFEACVVHDVTAPHDRRWPLTCARIAPAKSAQPLPRTNMPTEPTAQWKAAAALRTVARLAPLARVAHVAPVAVKAVAVCPLAAYQASVPSEGYLAEGTRQTKLLAVPTIGTDQHAHRSETTGKLMRARPSVMAFLAAHSCSTARSHHEASSAVVRAAGGD